MDQRKVPRRHRPAGKASGRASARDSAVRSASRLTRWFVAGSVGLMAAFSAVAASAFAGHAPATGNAAPAQPGGSAASTGRVALPPTKPGQLAAPQLPPVQAGGGGQAVSGGS